MGSLGEAAVLARIFPLLPAAAGQHLGPGDDAAVLATPDGRVVITTDMMIHGPDFRLAWSSPTDLGWKAAASNLSDIAAMGAVPTALVVALAAPAETRIEVLEGIADGLRLGCEELAPGCGVIGGDLSVSSVLTIAVSAFGDLEGRLPVLRSGARPSDIVAVSGSLGEAAAGLRLLFEQGVVAGEPDAAAAATLAAEHPAAIAAQLRPHPPIADGRAAAIAGATSMIDISDGLAIDARRVATSSGVALELSSLAVGSREALDGGEDHALLATFPDGIVLPGGFRPIGAVTAGSGLFVDGQPYDASTGWDPYSGWNGGAG
ncbi:MAG: thiamine-phosphate kinase [Salinibacterium sp.]|nr:MAG: thiamine-phosphate kinase [Salinibacterium sp.]